jgi:hypothetical protein
MSAAGGHDGCLVQRVSNNSSITMKALLAWHAPSGKNPWRVWPFQSYIYTRKNFLFFGTKIFFLLTTQKRVKQVRTHQRQDSNERTTRLWCLFIRVPYCIQYTRRRRRRRLSLSLYLYSTLLSLRKIEKKKMVQAVSSSADDAGRRTHENE